MKLLSQDARVGRFMIITVVPGGSPQFAGGSLGFDSYEDADSYRKSLSMAGGAEVYIVQVCGEWRYRSIAHEVHPKD